MAGSNPEEALDAYVEQARLALSSVVDAVLFGSGTAQNERHSLTLYARGQTRPNLIRFKTHGKRGEVLLRIFRRYTIVHQMDVIQRSPFDVWTFSYQYQILDRNEQELVVFHWNPDGESSVTTPHLHVPAAEPVILPQPAGSPVAGRKTYLNKLHLPTGRIGIEDVIEFLITDLEVDPLRPDWREIIDTSRLSSAR